jgi:hypothetical protein
MKTPGIFKIYTGVQGINNVFHIANKVENVLKKKKYFDNVEYVVYACTVLSN